MKYSKTKYINVILSHASLALASIKSAAFQAFQIEEKTFELCRRHAWHGFSFCQEIVILGLFLFGRKT